MLHYPTRLIGSTVATNLLGAPYVVGVEGARVAGRAADGTMVLQLRPSRPGEATVVLARSTRLPLVVGAALTKLGILGVLAVLAWTLVSQWWFARRRRKAPQPA